MLNVVHEGAMNPTNQNLLLTTRNLRQISSSRFESSKDYDCYDDDKGYREAGSADDVVKIVYALKGWSFIMTFLKPKW